MTTFTTPSAPGNEREVTERVCAAVEALAISERRLARLRTAVSEATMNAIEHGNRNRADLVIEVRVSASRHALVVRIVDQGGERARGAGPDLAAVDEPDLEAKLRGDHRPRGWGLFLIRSMVDELRTFEDERCHSVDLVLHMEQRQMPDLGA